MEAEVGLRELRQNASELIRRAEAGESLVVTVSGRPAARIVPVGGRTWRSWDEVAAVLSGPVAPSLPADLAELDDALADPFEREARRR
jgi:prevent-host-death family protein